MSTPEISALLRALADVIDRNSPAEIAEFTRIIANRTSPKGASARSPTKKNDKATNSYLDGITERVSGAVNRELAADILRKANLVRRDLITIAQRQNVHVVKEDTVTMIESKIVEALVGSRISSQAIRGE